MSSLRKAVVGGVLAAGFATVGLGPLLLTTLPNPRPVKIAALPHHLTGVFIGTRHGIYRTFPRATLQEKFPDDALVMHGNPKVYVKYRQLDRLTNYGIYKVTGVEVQVKRWERSDRVLVVTLKHALTPGRYYFRSARSGMFDGFDYYYFVVDSRKR